MDSGEEAQQVPPHVFTSCDQLEGVGVWQNITPTGVDLSSFGAITVEVDPINPATVYFGTNSSGLWKSTDCGATFIHIDTGTLGAELDKGAFEFKLDPIDPNVIYGSSLYGTNGLFKSTNGGVDWKSILPPNIAQFAPDGGFVGTIAIDPGNHLHVLTTWHNVCATPYTAACFAETHDGGETWTMRNGEASWAGGESTAINFINSTTWLFESSSNGLWVSVNEGDTWTMILGVTISHGAGQLYASPKGDFYQGTGTGVIYSPNGMTWTLEPNSGQQILSLVGDGTNIWASNAFPYSPGQYPPPYLPYYTASDSNPAKWTTFQSPKLTSGGAEMAYDSDHHLLYSANYWEGFWRVVVGGSGGGTDAAAGGGDAAGSIDSSVSD